MENWIAQLENAGSAQKSRGNRHSELIEKTLKEKKVYVFMATHAKTFDDVERSVTVISRNGFHHRSNINNNLLAIRIHWIEFLWCVSLYCRERGFDFFNHSDEEEFLNHWKEEEEERRRTEIPLICESFTDQLDS